MKHGDALQQNIGIVGYQHECFCQSYFAVLSYV